MKMRNNFLLFLTLLSATACKTAQHAGTVVSDEKPAVEIIANAGCRNSSIFPVEDEESLKSSLQAYSAGALQTLKFKTGKTEKGATCKLSMIRLTLNETCPPDANTAPAIKLQEVTTFETLSDKKMYTFEADTLISNQQLKPSQLSLRKPDYKPYLQPLTERNLKKAKAFFNTKK